MCGMCWSFSEKELISLCSRKEVAFSSVSVELLVSANTTQVTPRYHSFLSKQMHILLCNLVLLLVFLFTGTIRLIKIVNKNSSSRDKLQPPQCKNQKSVNWKTKNSVKWMKNLQMHKCYQWHTHTYNDIKNWPLINASKSLHWEVERVKEEKRLPLNFK